MSTMTNLKTAIYQTSHCVGIWYKAVLWWGLHHLFNLYWLYSLPGVVIQWEQKQLLTWGERERERERERDCTIHNVRLRYWMEFKVIFLLVNGIKMQNWTFISRRAKNNFLWIQSWHHCMPVNEQRIDINKNRFLHIIDNFYSHIVSRVLCT